MSWPVVKLSEIAEINPRRPAIEREDDAPTSFVPMEAVNDVLGEITQWVTKPYLNVKKGYTYFENGDVIFAKITPCMQNGKHAVLNSLADGFGFGSTEFHVIRAGNELAPEWIHYYLRRKETLDAAAKTFTGAVGQQRVPPNFLENLKIPCPPVEVQRQIAARLKAQLAEVDKARQAAEMQLRDTQALTNACMGDVFDSALAKSWPIQKLGEIAEVSGGIQKTPARKPVEHFRPFLTVRNVQRGYFDMSVVEQFEISESELEKYRLLDKDLLIVEGNGSPSHIGRNALFEADGQEWIHQNHIIRVRLNQAECLPAFASAYLNSEGGKAQMMEKAETTSGLYTLSTTKVKALEIPVPSLSVQAEAVNILEDSLKLTRQVWNTLFEQTKEIAHLPTRLLAQAFEM